MNECLAWHPKHAAQLEPLLCAASLLESGGGIRPSADFKLRARAKLTASPRRQQSHHKRTLLWATASLAALVLGFLVAGTAYAQSALPGDVFYPWKLASEKVWRMASPDPIQTDISILNRRVDEMNAVADDPARKAQALAGYIEVVTRLRSELDAERLQEVLPMPVPTEKPLPAAPTLTPAPPPKILPTIEIPPPLP